MIKHVYTTFGTRTILSQLTNKYPERHLLFLEADGSNEGLQLVDFSDQPTVFANATTYDVLADQQYNDRIGAANFIFCTLDDDERQVFDAKITRLASNQPPLGLSRLVALRDHRNPARQLLLTLWDDRDTLSNWRRSAGFEPLAMYQTGFYQYFETTFRRVITGQANEQDTSHA